MNTRSKVSGLVAVAAATILAITACGGSETPPPTEELLGFGACADKPTECNKGATKAGGTLVYYEEQDIATWNIQSADGGHYPTSVMLNSIIPGVYYAAPNYSPALNTNLMAEEPKVTSTSPQTVVYKIRPEAVVERRHADQRG